MSEIIYAPIGKAQCKCGHISAVMAVGETRIFACTKCGYGVMQTGRTGSIQDFFHSFSCIKEVPNETTPIAYSH